MVKMLLERAPGDVEGGLGERTGRRRASVVEGGDDVGGGFAVY